jgi:hypothetical protein
MLQAVLNTMLLCRHRRTTFPVTPGRAAATLPRTYIACLDCGSELPYDWNQMRVISARDPADPSPLGPREPIQDHPGPMMIENAAPQPPVCAVTPAAVLPPLTAPAGDGPQAAAAGGQYLIRAKLRIQQVQVALRVLNALTTGLAAQPDDVDKLKSWADPCQPACSTRELARRVVECAAS